MQLNSDFTQRVLIHSDTLAWRASPLPGVERRMLDRVGGEVARATSIVRYAPGSVFAPHSHDGGEEFIVLSGVFQDEHGDYPAGSYVRNPPTTRHTPGSAQGCIIFVKLWQFDLSDRTSVVTHIASAETQFPAARSGVAVIPLFSNARETVTVENWKPGTTIKLNLSAGAELLVLGGSCEESGKSLSQHSWLRMPIGDTLDAVAGDQGTKVWIKTGGLDFTNGPEASLRSQGVSS
jgi:ChrR Cupin-like domain